MDLLHLFRCGILACADRPDRLVGKHDVLPVGDQGLDGLELFLDNLDCLVVLSLSKSLSEAVDHLEPGLQSTFYLSCQDFIGLSEMGPSF